MASEWYSMSSWWNSLMIHLSMAFLATATWLSGSFCSQASVPPKGTDAKPFEMCLGYQWERDEDKLQGLGVIIVTDSPAIRWDVPLSLCMPLSHVYLCFGQMTVAVHDPGWRLWEGSSCKTLGNGYGSTMACCLWRLLKHECNSFKICCRPFFFQQQIVLMNRTWRKGETMNLHQAA